MSVSPDYSLPLFASFIGRLHKFLFQLRRPTKVRNVGDTGKAPSGLKV
ncbi:hypothetical protein EV664_1232 [Stakelama pacifica]|uniref:Uncharacterized protein n=1 Tax=Stakelama pacifica TaxID=517720 RepID=A0A4V3BS37_9SPHN|nr:hypothetical protein EV664_1232 [Stakelama pacifica]